MRSIIKRLLKDDAGVSAVEYALIATFVSIVIVAGASLLGKSLQAAFSKLSTSV